MKNPVSEGELKESFYNCGNDFQILSAVEKRGILKTAQTLLREQKKVKSLLANAGGNGPSPMEAGKRR